MQTSSFLKTSRQWPGRPFLFPAASFPQPPRRTMVVLEVMLDEPWGHLSAPSIGNHGKKIWGGGSTAVLGGRELPKLLNTWSP